MFNGIAGSKIEPKKEWRRGSINFITSKNMAALEKLDFFLRSLKIALRLSTHVKSVLLDCVNESSAYKKN